VAEGAALGQAEFADAKAALATADLKEVELELAFRR
jgi:hypothetical protein